MILRKASSTTIAVPSAGRFDGGDTRKTQSHSSVTIVHASQQKLPKAQDVLDGQLMHHPHEGAVGFVATTLRGVAPVVANTRAD
ncbi:MAG: hypothetical protein NT069_10930 [Planctomycetota bacterium]|nr:hypothetical protein [Planctomycetota bacterium]